MCIIQVDEESQPLSQSLSKTTEEQEIRPRHLWLPEPDMQAFLSDTLP